MNKKQYLIIIIILGIGLGTSTSFAVERNFEVYEQRELKESFVEEVVKWQKDPCPNNFTFVRDNGLEHCVPDEIINPANDNMLTYLKQFDEFNKVQVKVLGCGEGLTETQCYFKGMEITEEVMMVLEPNLALAINIWENNRAEFTDKEWNSIIAPKIYNCNLPTLTILWEEYCEQHSQVSVSEN